MARERIIWMDMMRGFLILLVITQHWISDFNIHNDLSDSIFYRGIYQIKIFFAPYRMELLFFLSGFIVHKSMSKYFRDYLSGKINNLLYPYVLWSSIFLVFHNSSYILSGEYVKIMNYMQGIIIGATNLTWFLYFLFVYFLISLPILKKGIPIVTVILSSVVFCYFSSKINVYNTLGIDFLKEGDIFYYFIFFYIGCYCGVQKYDLQALSKKPLMILISILCVIITELMNFYINLHKTNLLYLAPVILSIPLAIFIAMQIQRINFIKNILTHISLNSIVYYLMHVILLRVYSKIFEIVHLNQNIAFPLKLTLTLLSIYVFIVLKRRISLLNILFQPFYKKDKQTRPPVKEV